MIHVQTYFNFNCVYVSLCSYIGLYKYKQARMHYQVPEPEVIDSCDHPEMDAGN